MIHSNNDGIHLDGMAMKLLAMLVVVAGSDLLRPENSRVLVPILTKDFPASTKVFGTKDPASVIAHDVHERYFKKLYFPLDRLIERPIDGDEKENTYNN